LQEVKKFLSHLQNHFSRLKFLFHNWILSRSRNRLWSRRAGDFVRRLALVREKICHSATSCSHIKSADKLMIKSHYA
jgi:hypothetical protein